MKKFMLWMLALAALSGDALLAQDLTGTWQGTLLLPGGRELRTVIKVSKADGSALRAVMYSIDQGGQGIPVNPVTLQGSTVKMSVPGVGGSYEGKLEADGNTITGNWKQGYCTSMTDVCQNAAACAFGSSTVTCRRYSPVASLSIGILSLIGMVFKRLATRSVTLTGAVSNALTSPR